jgi:hypothetical protein
MHKTMLSAVLALALTAIGGPARSAMQKADRPWVSTAVVPVVCVGDRRKYRDFNHCWSVNIKRASAGATSRYCSRICGSGR